MIKEEFIKGITSYKNGIDYMEALDVDFSIDLFESSLANSSDTLFDLWLKCILKNDEAIDLVYWWLFETVDKIIYGDNDEVIATLDNEEDLFNYLNNNEYFK